MLPSRFRKKLDLLLLSTGSATLSKLVSVSPRCAYVRVTENCNSRCKTCYAWKNKSVKELATEEFNDVLRQLRDVGIEMVWLSGGESLTRNDIGELVKQCKWLGFKKIFVQTNGLLLHKKANELIANGVTHIDVSIDGIGQTNDWIRGVPHSYERSLLSIETVMKIRRERSSELPGITVFSTLLKQNLDEIPWLVEMCRRLRVFWDFSLLDSNVDFFKGIDFCRFRITDHKKIDMIIDYLKRTRRDAPGVISPSHTNLSLEFARRYLKGDLARLPCVLGFTHICIGSHGEVYSGCLAQAPVGNLRRTNLTQIMGSRRYRKNIEAMYMRRCPGCTFFFAVRLVVRYLATRELRRCLGR